jgi:hypothetical protein
MKKKLSYLSIIAVVVLFNGCGGGLSTTADTTPPVITNATVQFNVDEGTTKDVTLTANEKVTFSENSADADISGSKLTFTAPSYVVGGTNNYTVTVTAKDSAGNLATKNFIFNVQDVIVETVEANASYIAPTGDKDFTVVEGYLKDGSGLLWRDGDSGKKFYDDAKIYCESNQGWRLPTRGELLNLVDYDKGNTAGTKSLIDNSFAIFSNDSFDASWVEKTGSDKFVVNHKSGADTQEGIDLEQRVICVYGDKAGQHDIVDGTTVKDNTTGLEWTKIDPAAPGSTTYGDYTSAQSVCTNKGQGFDLPTINELRSVIDYTTNSIPYIAPSGVPAGTYFIWSKTESKNDNKNTHYLINLDTKASVTTDENNQTHYFTCVKRP